MASIKCGHCEQRHISVQEVRDCYATIPGNVRQLPSMSLSSNVLGSTVAPKPAEITEGFWKLDGEFYKVQRAVHGSGNLYAKRIMSAMGSTTWEYAPGAIGQLRRDGATPLTEADAAAFGKLYGVCMICSRTLTNEASIKRGIGPVCADKQGW